MISSTYERFICSSFNTIGMVMPELHDKCIKVSHMQALISHGATLEMSSPSKGALDVLGKIYTVEKGIYHDGKFYSMSQVPDRLRANEDMQHYHIKDPEVEVDKVLRLVGA